MESWCCEFFSWRAAWRTTIWVLRLVVKFRWLRSLTLKAFLQLKFPTLWDSLFTKKALEMKKLILGFLRDCSGNLRTGIGDGELCMMQRCGDGIASILSKRLLTFCWHHGITHWLWLHPCSCGPRKMVGIRWRPRCPHLLRCTWSLTRTWSPWSSTMTSAAIRSIVAAQKRLMELWWHWPRIPAFGFLDWILLCLYLFSFIKDIKMKDPWKLLVLFACFPRRSKKHRRFWTAKEMLSTLGHPVHPRTANDLGTEAFLYSKNQYISNTFWIYWKYWSLQLLYMFWFS